MRLKIIILISLMIPLIGNSQNDTLNQHDENNLKQGHWIYYGKDRPESCYPKDGKIEEGRYLNDRKEGLWIKYHIDGVTPKLKAEYHNNRPHGRYWKIYPDGTEKESGTFDRTYSNQLIRGRGAHKDLRIDSTYAFSANNNDTLTSKESAPIVTVPRTIGKSFDPHGYNKILNENDEIWQDGEFRSGKLWNGKVYIYDSDGVLLKVKVFKNGFYHSDGQL